MGHCSVLVIGENPLDMFDKFQRAEYADSTKNKYFAAVDILKEARARYERDTTRFLQDKDGGLHDPWDAQFCRLSIAPKETRHDDRRAHHHYLA